MKTKDQMAIHRVLQHYRGSVSSFVVYDANGTLIAGRPPKVHPGEVSFSAESFLKMREYAGARPALPRSKR